MVSHRDFYALGNGKTPEPFIGDIHAARTFRITDDYELCGLTFPQLLNPGINDSICPHAHHLAPDPDCTCGFYTYDNDKWWTPWNSHEDFPEVNARAIVRVSGKTVLCKRGLRSEKMELVALAVKAPDLVKGKLADKYDVPIFNNSSTLINEYPVTSIPRPKFTELQTFSNFVFGANWRALALSLLASIAILLIPYYSFNIFSFTAKQDSFSLKAFLAIVFLAPFVLIYTTQWLSTKASLHQSLLAQATFIFAHFCSMLLHSIIFMESSIRIMQVNSVGLNKTTTDLQEVNASKNESASIDNIDVENVSQSWDAITVLISIASGIYLMISLTLVLVAFISLLFHVLRMSSGGSARQRSRILAPNPETGKTEAWSALKMGEKRNPIDFSKFKDD